MLVCRSFSDSILLIQGELKYSSLGKTCLAGHEPSFHHGRPQSGISKQFSYDQFMLHQRLQFGFA